MLNLKNLYYEYMWVNYLLLVFVLAKFFPFSIIINKFFCITSPRSLENSVQPPHSLIHLHHQRPNPFVIHSAKYASSEGFSRFSCLRFNVLADHIYVQMYPRKIGLHFCFSQKKGIERKPRAVEIISETFTEKVAHRMQRTMKKGRRGKLYFYWRTFFSPLHNWWIRKFVSQVCERIFFTFKTSWLIYVTGIFV